MGEVSILGYTGDMIALKEKDREGVRLHGHERIQGQWTYENGGSEA